MKFSIIIPCWNQAQYLSEAIESALIQPGEREIIVINDGSPDVTSEVAKKYGEQIILINQVNKGLASARNTGIMNAKGEYIIPLDADDKLLPDALSKVEDFLMVNDADVIGFSGRSFGVREGDITLIPNPTFKDFKEGNRLAYCAAIKRSVLLEVGGYSPKMDILGGWEDLHLWYNLLHNGKKILTIQEPLFMYRTKETSMWTEAQKNKDALWDQIIKDFPEVEAHRK